MMKDEPRDRKLSWEVGILMYKLVFGKFPFKRGERNIKDVLEDILTKVLDFTENPIIVSDICIKIIESLLKKDQVIRTSIVTNIEFQNWSKDK